MSARRDKQVSSTARARIHGVPRRELHCFDVAVSLERRVLGRRIPIKARDAYSLAGVHISAIEAVGEQRYGWGYDHFAFDTLHSHVEREALARVPVLQETRSA